MMTSASHLTPSQNRGALRAVTWMAIVALAAGAPGFAFGDQVDVGAERFPRAKIVGIEDGMLKVRTSEYELAMLDLTTITRIYIDSTDGMEDFNEAESFVAQAEPAKALVRYERTVRFGDGFWSELVRVRFLRAADQAGNLNKAVMNFLHVLEGQSTGPAVAARLIPTNIPDATNEDVKRAISQLDRAATARNAPVPVCLIQLLRYDILRHVGNARAQAMRPAIARLVIPREVGTVRAYAIQAHAFESLFNQSATPEYLAWLDRAILAAPDPVAADLLMIKARHRLKQARTDEDRIRAAWLFMRVAIHFAREARAPEALLETAKIYVDLGRPDKVRLLLDECLAHAQASDSIRISAQKLMRTLPAGSEP